MVDGCIMVLEIIGAALIAVATAGAGSGVIAALAAKYGATIAATKIAVAIAGNLAISAVGMTIKAGALGDAYGAGDLGADVLKAIGTAGTAGLGEVKALSTMTSAWGKGVAGKLISEGAKEGGLIIGCETRGSISRGNWRRNEVLSGCSRRRNLQFRNR